MNCKPGDLAVIVASDFQQNIGRLVQVIRADTVYCFGPEWECECLSSVYVEDNDITGECFGEFWANAGRAVSIPDADLRPIRDPGDDARDESLLWLPVPTTTKKPEHA
jgi:hypothetical protein